MGFAYWAVTIYGRTFQTAPLAPRPPHGGPTTPGPRRHGPGLGWPPFARHYWGDHCCFLFLRVLRCFSSPRWPPTQHSAGWRASGPPGSPIREPRDQRLHAPTPGLSRLAAPFVASVSQGIHRAPLATFLRIGATTKQGGRRPSAARPREQRPATSGRAHQNGPRVGSLNVYLRVTPCQRSYPKAHTVQGKVENNGFEPLTPCLQSRCSSQLS